MQPEHSQTDELSELNHMHPETEVQNAPRFEVIKSILSLRTTESI